MKHKSRKNPFGDRVRRYREMIVGVSVREAAQHIGIGHATLSRVENGKTPDIFTLAKLCRWLGFDVGRALVDLGAVKQIDLEWASLEQHLTKWRRK